MYGKKLSEIVDSIIPKKIIQLQVENLSLIGVHLDKDMLYSP
jgi:hypothetical protein